MSTPLGDLVTATREGKRWTRQDLSAASGVSYPYISQIETGTRIPSLKTLRQLADALDLPVSDLAALVAPDAWAGTAPMLMSPSAGQDWGLGSSEPMRSRDPSRERIKDSVRRKLRDLPPVVRLQVLAELSGETARDLEQES
jgi:transcriptional regulator with XRE-family HTH domain